ncbi:MBL fold metallo-hydrolase [Alteromonas sp. ASW11-130]|uniref:MBL fold metallo-hydrolase n=1 Tax=Alteromonas sp. ASW11-130 TaxID=3015775 RepID=UPI002241D729|nr:MBL fold metallo-hydrolase [Alteromonas sp. ASW11-130]MCW8092495.1 MBL fold metallo-hydrolase [Alteromonas sp. ASW11-130]
MNSNGENHEFYLKDEVYFEPLFNKWYAWPYLIPPVTAARYTEKTHLRIMKSFVNNYQLHILAAQESELSGGEFLNCTKEQVEEIRALIDRTETHYGDCVKLSKAISQLDKLLVSHTDGTSLEPLYKDVPEMLRGYVELTYDRHHRAGFRLIEPLLYNSDFYHPELQSLSFGLISKVDERPFVLSTPRLADDNHLQVAANFNHSFVDKIFKARTQPVSQAEIDEMFEGLELTGGLNYQELFTTDKPVHKSLGVKDGVQLRYLGHAGFLVQTEHVSVLIDPIIATRSTKNCDQVVSFTELPDHIDYVCLTHTHQDHVNFETLLQLRHKIGKIVVPKNNGGELQDPSLKLMLSQLGFSVIELDECEDVHVTEGVITSIPFFGEHGDLNIRSKSAWLLNIEGRKMFFGADSANPDISLYKNLKPYMENLDVYAIGMECVGAPYTWLYGALCTEKVPNSIKDTRRLNGSDADQASEVVELIKPEHIFVYALGMEPWYKYFMGIEYDENSEQVKQIERFSVAAGLWNIEVESLFGKRDLFFPKVG